MSDNDQDEADLPKGLVVWAQYAKERYDAEEKRLTDFRNWARQLAAAVGVVIGLEAALLGQLIKLDKAPAAALITGLFVLLANVAYQLWIVSRAAACGYVGKPTLGPESPSVLSEHREWIKDETTARRTVGSYYSMGADNVHQTAEEVVKQVGGLVRHFVRSLFFLFVGMLVVASLAPLNGRDHMADKPASNDGASSTTTPASTSTPASTPTTTPTPAAGSSTPGPLMSTPTPGRTETRSGPTAGEKLVQTPTRGQLVTGNKAKK